MMSLNVFSFLKEEIPDSYTILAVCVLIIYLLCLKFLVGVMLLKKMMLMFDCYLLDCIMYAA